MIGGLKEDLFVSSADDSKPESAPDDFSINTKGNDGPEFWSDVRRIWRFVHFVAAWICVVVFVGWGFIKTDMNFRFGSMEIGLLTDIDANGLDNWTLTVLELGGGIGFTDVTAGR